LSLLSVLLLSDDAGFANGVVARWLAEDTAPVFVHLGTDFWDDGRAQACDIAIVGPLRLPQAATVLRELDATGISVVVAGSDNPELDRMFRAYPQWRFLSKGAQNLDLLVMLASESLQRSEACLHARRAEQALMDAQPLMEVGRFMTEMRHSMNNTLTSVLGNAELLMIEPGALTPQAGKQLQVIHSMTMKLFELMHRLARVESEARHMHKEALSSTTSDSLEPVSVHLR
jgi:signal transduction histidine kinase